MALNRRNVLVALGAVVGGGGALVGTGAFSTVSAERSVEVSTAGDASGFLGIEADDEYVGDNSGSGQLSINLGAPGDAGFNDDAVTTITDVLILTNNAQDGSDATVGVSNNAPSEDPTASGEVTVSLSEADVSFYVGGIDIRSTQQITPGESATIDVAVDTTVSNGGASSSGSLTIVATEP